MLFGCYAEVAKEEIEKIDEVDLVLGNHQKANIDRYIESYFEGKELKDEAIDNYFYDFGSITYTEKQGQLLKFKMVVIIFVVIVLFHMLVEEFAVESQKVFLKRLIK